MIFLDDVSYRYPGSDRLALKGISISFPPREMVGVVGPNGSGKSTLARLCNGLYLPTSGRVLVDGHDTVSRQGRWEARRRVGMVFQNPDNQMVATTVWRDVAFGPENLGWDRAEIRRRVDEALELVGIRDLASAPIHLLTPGQRHLVALAGVLAMKPSYLILDEATVSLDADTRASVLRMLGDIHQQRGLGVIIITHDMSELALADRAVVLDAGRLCFDGSPRELFRKPDLLRSAGLEPPPLHQLAAELRRLGVEVPEEPRTIEELVACLAR